MPGFKFEGIDIPTWDTIKGYFTKIDQQHMLAVTGGQMDLWDCKSVGENAQGIYDRVSDGSMPPGGPKWTPEMINNFFTWWKAGASCS
ncbi:MAG TPA: hypothetical protein VGM89_12620 [Puia sp.]|jgi:hypothetical protein